MKRVLLTGAAGQLGSIIEKTCPGSFSLHAFTRSMLDLTDKHQILAELERINPDIVINCSAYTGVDQAECEQKQAFNVNAEAVQNIIDSVVTIAKNIRIVHLSTDFVFSGPSDHPYLPSDIPNPVSIYGESKLLGEQNIIQSRFADYIIVRTSWLYSGQGRNFLTTMLKLMSEKNKLRIVNDQFGSPTWANTLAGVIWKLVKNTQANGIYHWSDKGVISWYDFANEIYTIGREIGILHNTIEIEPVSTSAYLASLDCRKKIAPRPVYSALNSSKTEKEIGTLTIPWKIQLSKAMCDIKENSIAL